MQFDWFVWLASASGLIASWITIFGFVQRNFSKEHEAKLGEFLSGQDTKVEAPAESPPGKKPRTETLADHFLRIFDSFFRPGGKRFISFRRSMFATTLGLVVCAGIVTSVGGVEPWKESWGNSPSPWTTIIFLLVVNYVSDWISLIETRVVISIFRNYRSNVLVFIFLVLIDYIFTIMIITMVLFVLGVLYFGDIIYKSTSFQWLDALIELLTFPYSIPAECLSSQPDDRCGNPFAVTVFMTTFITTIWFIVFAIVTWLSRGPIKWFRGPNAPAIRNPFAVLVALFALVSFGLLLLIPLVALR